MSNQKKAYLYAGCAVFLWSTVASAFKLTLRRVDFITLVFYASLVSSIFLFILLFTKGKTKQLGELFRLRSRDIDAEEGVGGGLDKEASGTTSSRDIRSKAARALGRSAIMGFLNPFLYYLVLFKAYSLLPAQEAQPLNFIWPVVLSILAVVVLKEKLRIRSLCALLISFFGVVVISTRGDIWGFRIANPPGALLAVGSTFIWSSYWLLNLKDERDEVQKLFLGFFFGFLYIAVARAILAFWGTLEGLQGIPWSSTQGGGFRSRLGFILPEADPLGLIGCIYVGLFEMGAAFVLWLKALHLTESTAKISNLIYFAPFVSLVLIHFFVGEQILPSSIIGLVFIVGGVVLQSRVK